MRSAGRAPTFLSVTVLATLLGCGGLPAQDVGERFFDQQYDVRAGGTLRVDLGDSDVLIRTGSANVRVEVFVDSDDSDWSQQIFERLDFQAEARGNSVVVNARNPRVSDREWRTHRGMNVTTVIHVPAEFDLEVETGDGDVDVEDIAGAVDVRTGDGDVHLSEVRGTRLSLASGDGDLVARHVEVDQATIQSSDGDIRLEGLSGEVSVRTGDGDVEITLIRMADAEIRTGDGDVTVYAPRQLDAEIVLEGEDVEVEMPVTVRGRISDERVVGTIGDGGPRLRVTTGDGSVRLRAGR